MADSVSIKTMIDVLDMSYTYSNVDGGNTLVPQSLVIDLIAFLKAQEPRLVTKEDFEDKTKVDNAGGLPVWVEYRRDDEWGEYWEDTDDEWAIVYKQHYRTEKSMRYWTSRPDDKQREATPWTA